VKTHPPGLPHAPRTARKILRSARGAFDLPSIIAGVVVVGILTAGVLAAIFGVIPFAQDNGAKQDLAAIRTAEGTARAKDNRFMNRDDLKAAGYVNNPGKISVGVNTAGSCYVAIAMSATGHAFYATDAKTDPQSYIQGTDTGCLAADEQQILAAVVGAVTIPVQALVNPGFEADFANWTTTGATTAISTATVHSGKKAAMLVGNVGSSATSVQQTPVTVPADGATILTFWYDWAKGESIRHVSVEAYNVAGTKLGAPWTVANDKTTGAWTQEKVDLTPFKGQDITLKFNGSVDPRAPFYLDDVSVTTTAAEAPTAAVAWADDSSATVQWAAPAYGSVAVTSYTVTPYLNGTAQAPTKVTGTPPATTTTVTGLTNGADYTFTVKATNQVGSSPESSPSAQIKIGRNWVANPGFEAGLTNWTTTGATTAVSTTTVHSGTKSGMLAGNTASSATSVQQAPVTIPADGATILTFWYNWAAGDSIRYVNIEAYNLAGTKLGTPWTIRNNLATGAWTQAKVDLTPYKGQDIKLKVSGSVASSPAFYLDDISVTTTAAETPTGAVAWGGDASATVQWNAPAYGAEAVTNYTVIPYLNGAAQAPTTVTGAPAATKTVITGLTNGASYTFTVKATNALGTSGESTPSAAITVNPNAAANGGFEAGLSQWSTPVRATASTASAHTGTGSLLLKGDMGSGSAFIEQTVTVPATGTPSISYWTDFRQVSNSASIRVEVYPVIGSTMLGATPYATLAPNGGWKQNTADLSAYKGQTVRLRVGGNVYYSNALYVDDVTLR
jgi:hypothetical protein